jgi:sulfur-oxidizing protein SoxX
MSDPAVRAGVKSSNEAENGSWREDTVRDTCKNGLIGAALLMAVGTSAWAAGPVGPNDVKFEDATVKASLTGQPGDAVAGRKAFADKKLGNCLACHKNSEMSEQLFHGEVGTPLDGVADRWKPEELRAIVVNSKQVFGPDTVMPGFYTLEVGAHVAKNFQGQTILTAQQVEDIVAYLGTLKE